MRRGVMYMIAPMMATLRAPTSLRRQCLRLDALLAIKAGLGGNVPYRILERGISILLCCFWNGPLSNVTRLIVARQHQQHIYSTHLALGAQLSVWSNHSVVG
jgi:hypothetical protein